MSFSSINPAVTMTVVNVDSLGPVSELSMERFNSHTFLQLFFLYFFFFFSSSVTTLLCKFGVQMPLGRRCVDHYRLLHRYCVFSHDEMVCNMATKADNLDVVLASAVQKDMRLMIREERELRDKVRKMVSGHKQNLPSLCVCVCVRVMQFV